MSRRGEERAVEVLLSEYYSVGTRAGTAAGTPRGKPHFGRCRGRGSGGWCPGTWTAQC